MELLIISKHPFRAEYVMRDCKGAHISTNARFEPLLAYCQEAGYRACVEENGRILQWFTPA